jgi:hypothetical protein
MDTVVVESCHSIWVFDPDRMRFCRILKGIEVAHRRVITEWRPYSALEMDQPAETFTVYLNPARTRLIRSWRHGEDCAECGGRTTVELSLQDIRHSVPV